MSLAGQKDGGWGWVVVGAAFLLRFIMDGLTYSHGILYLELLDEFQKGQGETAWVISLQGAVKALSTALTAYLISRFGCRPVIILGSVLASLGYVISSFVCEMFHLYFTFGIISGIGLSMMHLPCRLAIIEYFTLKRTLAMGISLTGAGVGIFVFGPLSKWLIDLFGWRGTLLIEAGIICNGAVCGALVRPLNLARAKAYRNQPEPEPEGQELDILISNSGETQENDNCNNETNHAQPLSRKDLLMRNDNQNLKRHQQKGMKLSATRTGDDSETFNSLNAKTQMSDLSSCTDENNGHTPKRLNNGNTKTSSIRWICSYLTNIKFICICISLIFEVLAYLTPYVFIPDMMVKNGFTRTDAVIVLSAMGITNTVCRPLAGWVGDRPRFRGHRTLIFGAALAASGVFLSLVPFVISSYVALICVCSAYSVVVATWVVLENLVLADVFGDSEVNRLSSITHLVMIPPALLGTPITGWLYDAFGRHDIPFVLAGCEYLLAGVFVSFVPIYTAWGRHKKTQSQEPEEIQYE